MKSFKSYITETSLSRVHSHTQNRNIGMITAHRSTNTAKENDEANAKLHKDIRDAGFGLLNVTGHYVENKGEPTERKVKEHSFLVIGDKGHDNGKLKGFLKKHGEKYGQDSVLHKSHNEKNAKLIGTRDGEWIKKGQEVDVGEYHPNRTGEYHTQLKGGNKRTFAFESVEFKEDKSFFSRGNSKELL